MCAERQLQCSCQWTQPHEVLSMPTESMLTWPVWQKPPNPKHLSSHALVTMLPSPVRGGCRDQTQTAHDCPMYNTLDSHTHFPVTESSKADAPLQHNNRWVGCCCMAYDQHPHAASLCRKWHFLAAACILPCPRPRVQNAHASRCTYAQDSNPISTTPA